MRTKIRLSEKFPNYFNPLIPARVKFAWFRCVQKCTFLVFHSKFDSVPSKIFSMKISLPGKNRFPIHWWHSQNPRPYRLTLTGRKLKADLTKKYFFPLFHLKWFKASKIKEKKNTKKFFVLKKTLKSSHHKKSKKNFFLVKSALSFLTTTTKWLIERFWK